MFESFIKGYIFNDNPKIMLQSQKKLKKKKKSNFILNMYVNT